MGIVEIWQENDSTLVKTILFHTLNPIPSVVSLGSTIYSRPKGLLNFGVYMDSNHDVNPP